MSKNHIYIYFILLLSISNLFSAPIGVSSGFNSGDAKIVTFTGYGPNGMGVDGSDNIYLHTDNSNSGLAILKVSSTGVVATAYDDYAVANYSDSDTNDGVLVDTNKPAAEYDMTTLSDGTILVADRNELHKYSASGVRDDSFEGNIATSFSGMTGDVRGGSIIVSGSSIFYAAYTYTTSSDGVYYLAKLNSDGTLDSSFNGGSILTITVNYNGHSSPEIAVDSQGRVVVVGLDGSEAKIYRYNGTTGASDGTFTTSTSGSFIATYPSSRIMGIDIDSSDNIYIAVQGSSNNGVLAKVKADLSGLDTSFNTIGYITDTKYYRDVVISSDSKVIVGAHDGSGFYALKYNSDGTLDTSFNTNGWAYADVASPDVAEVEILSDGKIVVGGASSSSFAVVVFDNTIPNTAKLSLKAHGGVVQLEGTGDFGIVTPFMAPEDNVTIEGWFNWNGSGTTNQNLFKNGKDYGYALYLNTSSTPAKYSLTLPANGVCGDIDASSATVNPNIWNHIALTRENGVWHLFENGVELSLTGTTSCTPVTSDYNLSIGFNPNPAYISSFSGQFDEVRVWNIAKTAGDINTTMNHQLDGNESGLVAYYNFDERVGDRVIDISGNGNYGTIEGNVTRLNFLGDGLKFDGVDDGITIPHNSNVKFDTDDNFTVSLWVKANPIQSDTANIDNTIIDSYINGGGSAFPFSIRYINQTHSTYAKTIRVSRYDATNEPSIISSPISDGYNFVSFVKNGETLSLYINGELESTATDTTTATTQNTNNIFIGSRVNTVNTFSNGFTGEISQLSIYKKALNQSELQHLMTSSPDISDGFLVGYWPLNEGSDSTIKDYSSTSNNGTINGATWLNTAPTIYGDKIYTTDGIISDTKIALEDNSTAPIYAITPTNTNYSLAVDKIIYTGIDTNQSFTLNDSGNSLSLPINTVGYPYALDFNLNLSNVDLTTHNITNIQVVGVDGNSENFSIPDTIVNGNNNFTTPVSNPDQNISIRFDENSSGVIKEWWYNFCDSKLYPFNDTSACFKNTISSTNHIFNASLISTNFILLPSSFTLNASYKLDWGTSDTISSSYTVTAGSFVIPNQKKYTIVLKASDGTELANNSTVPYKNFVGYLATGTYIIDITPKDSYTNDDFVIHFDTQQMPEDFMIGSSSLIVSKNTTKTGYLGIFGKNVDGNIITDFSAYTVTYSSLTPSLFSVNNTSGDITPITDQTGAGLMGVYINGIEYLVVPVYVVDFTNSHTSLALNSNTTLNMTDKQSISYDITSSEINLLSISSSNSCDILGVLIEKDTKKQTNFNLNDTSTYSNILGVKNYTLSLLALEDCSTTLSLSSNNTPTTTPLDLRINNTLNITNSKIYDITTEVADIDLNITTGEDLDIKSYNSSGALVETIEVRGAIYTSLIIGTVNDGYMVVEPRYNTTSLTLNTVGATMAANMVLTLNNTADALYPINSVIFKGQGGANDVTFSSVDGVTYKSNLVDGSSYILAIGDTNSDTYNYNFTKQILQSISIPTTADHSYTKTTGDVTLSIDVSKGTIRALDGNITFGSENFIVKSDRYFYFTNSVSQTSGLLNFVVNKQLADKSAAAIELNQSDLVQMSAKVQVVQAASGNTASISLIDTNTTLDPAYGATLAFGDVGFMVSIDVDNTLAKAVAIFYDKDTLSQHTLFSENIYESSDYFLSKTLNYNIWVEGHRVYFNITDSNTQVGKLVSFDMPSNTGYTIDKFNTKKIGLSSDGVSTTSLGVSSINLYSVDSNTSLTNNYIKYIPQLKSYSTSAIYDTLNTPAVQSVVEINHDDSYELNSTNISQILIENDMFYKKDIKVDSSGYISEHSDNMITLSEFGIGVKSNGVLTQTELNTLYSFQSSTIFQSEASGYKYLIKQLKSECKVHNTQTTTYTTLSDLISDYSTVGKKPIGKDYFNQFSGVLFQDGTTNLVSYNYSTQTSTVIGGYETLSNISCEDESGNTITIPSLIKFNYNQGVFFSQTAIGFDSTSKTLYHIEYVPVDTIYEMVFLNESGSRDLASYMGISIPKIKYELKDLWTYISIPSQTTICDTDYQSTLSDICDQNSTLESIFGSLDIFSYSDGWSHYGPSEYNINNMKSISYKDGILIKSQTIQTIEIPYDIFLPLKKDIMDISVSGWRLMSVPFQTTPQSLEILLESDGAQLETIFYFSNNSWIVYSPNNETIYDDYTKLQTIPAGAIIWVYTQ
jgi:uncharacterized delta-60 repeat protein